MQRDNREALFPRGGRNGTRATIFSTLKLCGGNRGPRAISFVFRFVTLRAPTGKKVKHRDTNSPHNTEAGVCGHSGENGFGETYSCVRISSLIRSTADSPPVPKVPIKQTALEDISGPSAGNSIF